jgi:uncharacterized coiled-coil DUF342 family protein
LYVAIRGAVDNDGDRANALIIDLGKLRYQLNKNANDQESIRNAREKLQQDIEDASWSDKALGEMRDNLRTRLGEHKKSLVLLDDASSFWRRVKEIHLSGIGETVQQIEEIKKKLS